ncbi:MAG: polysaccharide deacetylase family protein, partial [Clostridia bacterium]|nr:polysaccharide deacetylase family protein [Clostridia bacterium]
MKKFLVLLALCIVVAAIPAGAEDSSIVYHAHANDSGKIALTFDDGPHPKYTPEILEILREYGVKATFFVIGENVGYYPEQLAQILADGHEIGNHTYRHSCMSKLSEDEIRNEIERNEQAIYELCDYRTKLLRPPAGMLDDRVIDIALERDYRIILWNIDTRDWDHT